MDVELLEEYFLEKFVPKLDIQSRLSLLFVVIGDKSGANLMFIDESRQEVLEEFCEDFDLEYKFFETEIHRKYYITKDEENFVYLEKLEEDKPYHTKRSEGKFLGYPGNAVDFFINNSGNRDLLDRYEDKVDDLIERGRLEEENTFLLDLVLFVPELTEKGIKDAIEIGEKRRELLRQFDRTNNTKIGENLLEEVFGRDTPYFRRLN